jgi:hypothetical protein
LSEARGELVSFLDSDDVMLPGNLAKLQAQLVRNPRANVAHGWAVFRGPRQGDVQQLQPRLRGRCPNQLLFRNVLAMGTVLMRHGCWRPIGGFDPLLPIFEDWDFWLRLSFHCVFDFVPEVVARISTQEVRRNTSRPAASVGATVRVIYDKLLDDPTAGPIVGGRIRQLMANVHVTTGHQYRVFDHNYAAARREFLRAIRVAPDMSLAYVGLLESMAVGPTIEWLRLARSALFRRRS